MVMAENLTFQLVVAATRSWGIGRGKTLPWRLPKDMAFFKDLTSLTKDPTKRNAVIMGRTTWESIPEKFRPLPGRVNVVLSRSIASDENSSSLANGLKHDGQHVKAEGVHYFPDLESALEFLGGASVRAGIEHVFVIGGGMVYRYTPWPQHCPTASQLPSVDPMVVDKHGVHANTPLHPSFGVSDGHVLQTVLSSRCRPLERTLP